MEQEWSKAGGTEQADRAAEWGAMGLSCESRGLMLQSHEFTWHLKVLMMLRGHEVTDHWALYADRA